MRYVFANRICLCVFRLFFLLAGISVAPLASAQIDPGDTYCSNYMYGLSDNDFSIGFNISLNSYNNGWEAPAYTYMQVGNYNCEMIHRPQLRVCLVYEDEGNVTCEVGYALTGRKWRGSNPGSDYYNDSSLNPSNPYMNYDGSFDRGTNCNEGEHIYTPFPKGYRYVPFDGFKFFSNDVWRPCLSQVAFDAEDVYGDGSGMMGEFYERSPAVKSYSWNSGFSYGNKTCASIQHDCLSVVMDVYPHWWDDDFKSHYIYRFSSPFYARCPPYAKFSPVNGACYMLEADELLVGTNISNDDLYAQPGRGDKIGIDFNSVNLLSKVSKSGINQCPSPLTTNFKGKTITFFDYTSSCQMLSDYVKPFVLLLGSFISIAILLGISTASISANEG